MTTGKQIEDGISNEQYEERCPDKTTEKEMPTAIFINHVTGRRVEYVPKSTIQPQLAAADGMAKALEGAIDTHGYEEGFLDFETKAMTDARQALLEWNRVKEGV